MAAKTKQVSAQQRAVLQLKALAAPYRFRVQADVEGFPVIPGRYGQIEWFDGRDLAVHTNHRRLFARLWATPGVRRHQTGDTEMRAVFGPDALEQVARLVRAKRWGGTGRGRPENLRPGPGQVGAWGLKKAVFEQRAGVGLAPGLNSQQGP